MSRISKIARLPRSIRDELNRRLECSAPASNLIKWLNALPDVKTLLRESFDSEPISEQNISNWRHGGFLQWQTRQEFLEKLPPLSDEAADLAATVGYMSDHAARLLSIHFALALSASLQASPNLQAPSQASPPDSPSEASESEASPPTPTPLQPQSSLSESLASLKPLIELARAIAALRRGDHQSTRLKVFLDDIREKNETKTTNLTLEQEIHLIRSRGREDTPPPPPPAPAPASPPRARRKTTPPPASAPPKNATTSAQPCTSPRPTPPAPVPSVPSVPSVLPPPPQVKSSYPAIFPPHAEFDPPKIPRAILAGQPRH